MTTSHHGCQEFRQIPLISEDNSPPAQSHCARCHEAILQALERRVDEIDGHAKQLYIGRSNYPERRLLEHFTDRGKVAAKKANTPAARRDRLSVLHWSASWRETAAFESELIAKFKSRGKLKLDNIAHESCGQWSGPWNCLYVSWAAKSGKELTAAMSTLAVAHLHWAVVSPDLASWKREPKHLTIGHELSSDAAAKTELDALGLRRRQFVKEIRENRLRR